MQTEHSTLTTIFLFLPNYSSSNPEFSLQSELHRGGSTTLLYVLLKSSSFLIQLGIADVGKESLVHVHIYNVKLGPLTQSHFKAKVTIRQFSGYRKIKSI